MNTNSLNSKLRIAATLALIVAGGLWLSRRHWTAPIPSVSSPMDSGVPRLHGGERRAVEPDPVPRPPDPDRKFRDLTPEERVGLAQNPRGVGG